MVGKTPSLEDSCFYYFFRPEEGVRDYENVNFRIHDLEEVVKKAVDGSPVKLRCPGSHASNMSLAPPAGCTAP